MKAVGLISAICVTIAMLLAGPAQAGTVYFLVSEFPGAVSNGDSFVLPLNKADDISHARELIRLGTSAGRPLVFADIVAGGDHINRNLRASNSPSWSWRISRFDSFADGGIELVDGWGLAISSTMSPAGSTTRAAAPSTATATAIPTAARPSARLASGVTP